MRERAEEMRHILAREELFMRDIEGLLPQKPGLVRDAGEVDRPVRSARRYPNPALERALQRPASRSRSPSPEPTRPQTPANFAVVGMVTTSSDEWWCDPSPQPLHGAARRTRTPDDLVHRFDAGRREPFDETAQRRLVWRRPDSLSDLRRSVGSALEPDPARAWLRPSSSALPLRPRLEPVKPRDLSPSGKKREKALKGKA